MYYCILQAASVRIHMHMYPCMYVYVYKYTYSSTFTRTVRLNSLQNIFNSTSVQAETIQEYTVRDCMNQVCHFEAANFCVPEQ